MAQAWVTGPAHIFLSFYSSIAVSGPAGVVTTLTTPIYLGTTERVPRLRIRAGWTPVFNDLTGGVIPYDMLYEGEEAFITGDFTRFNETTIRLLQARPRHFLQPTNRGTIQLLDQGTLMLTEGYAFQLSMFFPYSSKLAFAGMPLGYRFPAAWLEGPDDLDNLGTVARVDRLVFHALRIINLSNATMTLCDENVGPMPAIN
jgi:hypothetical protein